jgi:hypothetical protein
MPNVLRVSALELCHPGLLVVLMKADDTPWHSGAIGDHSSHRST